METFTQTLNHYHLYVQQKQKITSVSINPSIRRCSLVLFPRAHVGISDVYQTQENFSQIVL